MSIKARLRGDSIDLAILAELFPPSSDPSVSTDSDGYYLTSASLPDDLIADAGAMHRRASSLLRDVNGGARVLRSDFRPVELVGRFSDPVGGVHAVVVADTIEVRSHVHVVAVVTDTAGEVQPGPSPTAPRFVQLAAKHPEVHEVLALLAKPTLDPVDLYKIKEIVCEHATGNREAHDRLAAKGWVSLADLKAFIEWANRPDASGEAARHARQSGPPPSQNLSAEDARQLIRVLVSRWLDSL